MQKILITILLVAALLVLVAFCFFAAFHYSADDKPTKIFLISMGVFTLVMTVVIAIGLMMM